MDFFIKCIIAMAVFTFGPLVFCLAFGLIAAGVAALTKKGDDQ